MWSMLTLPRAIRPPQLENALHRVDQGVDDGIINAFQAAGLTTIAALWSPLRKTEVIERRKRHLERYRRRPAAAVPAAAAAAGGGGEAADSAADAASKKCIVCELRPIAVALVPCGHSQLCEECAAALALKSDECPTCRQKVSMRLKLFGR